MKKITFCSVIIFLTVETALSSASCDLASMWRCKTFFGSSMGTCGAW